MLKSGFRLLLIALTLVSGAFMNSCQKNEAIITSMGEPVSLSASASNLVLTQKQANVTAQNFTWTRGTNLGTGSSISYTLQIDKEGNNFAKAKTYNMGKGVFAKAFTVDALNDLLLNYWVVKAGTSANLEARITADVTAEGVEDGVAKTVKFTATPYEPVSKTLYMFGSVTPNGWNVNAATPMIASENDPTTFTYKGVLSRGELKFLTTLGAYLPSYQKGVNATSLFFRTADSQADDKFIISESGIYAITLNLVDLTISVIKQAGPAYDKLYMVGSATPNGWDIANATPMVQNQNNLFQFTYDGLLTAGEMKFPVNRNTDWGQDMIMPNPADPSKIYVHKGGDTDDNKWTIATANYYHVVVDLAKNTISIAPFKLYMVGSASPVGWDIGNAVELVQDATNWYIFRYTGPLVEGEFKFPVNRNSDWGQNMYMPLTADPTKIYLHKGGDPDDNKWSISAANAGNYIITVNVKDLTISLVKQ